MNYVTLEEVKTYCNIPLDNTNFDGAINMLVPALSRATDRHCRRTFHLKTETQLYDFPRHPDRSNDHDWVKPRSKGQLFLRDELYSLTEIINGDGSTITPDQVLLFPASGPPYQRLTLRIDQPAVFTYNDVPEQSIQVTGEWGFSDGPPEDVKLGVLTWVAYALNTQGDSSGVIVKSLGDFSESFNIDITPQFNEISARPPHFVSALLDGYRRRHISSALVGS